MICVTSERAGIAGEDGGFVKKTQVKKTRRKKTQDGRRRLVEGLEEES